MPDERAMAEARTCLHLGRQPGCDDCDKFARALQWQTAKRVVSDDHPQECPCIRDHLEVAFLLGMDEAAGRAETPDADEDVLWGAVRPESWQGGRGFGPERRAYKRANRLHERTLKRFEAAIRAEERNRLLNPSPELVEAVALAIATASGEEYFEELFEDYCDMARAALQAAGKEMQ